MTGEIKPSVRTNQTSRNKSNYASASFSDSLNNCRLPDREQYVNMAYIP
ncbi:MAG: hypothetical protein ACUVTU_09185 [Desulfurispora sp.]